jgi:hypothetical protein
VWKGLTLRLARRMEMVMMEMTKIKGAGGDSDEEYDGLDDYDQMEIDERKGRADTTLASTP